MKGFPLAFLMMFSSTAGLAAVKYGDLYNPNGSARVQWKDMNEEQKAFYLEEHRKEAEFALSNVGKSIGEIDAKTAPEGLHRFLQRANPNQKFSSSKAIAIAYQKLGDLDNAIKQQRLVSTQAEVGEKPRELETLVSLLAEAGRYQEALDAYMEYLRATFPEIQNAKGEVFKTAEEFRKAPEPVKMNAEYPDALHGLAKWERLAKDPAAQKVDQQRIASELNSEPAARMHHLFYSKDPAERLKALEFYHQNKVRFMLEKAAHDGDASVRSQAQAHLQKLDQGQ